MQSENLRFKRVQHKCHRGVLFDIQAKEQQAELLYISTVISEHQLDFANAEGSDEGHTNLVFLMINLGLVSRFQVYL